MPMQIAPKVPKVPTMMAAIITPINFRDIMLAVAPGMMVRAVIMRKPTMRTQTTMTREIIMRRRVLMRRVLTPLTRAISSSRVV